MPDSEMMEEAQEPLADTTDPEALKEALAEQTAKAEAHLANWQRAEADLANFKKRSDQEKQELASFGNAVLISGLLPVLDDLERAFDSMDASLAGLTWVEGLTLIYKKLRAVLEAQGLSVINALGETFDPKVHEAVMEIEGEDGKVVGEMQKGYRLKERVVRPVMVKVGRGHKPQEGTNGSPEASTNG